MTAASSSPVAPQAQPAGAFLWSAGAWFGSQFGVSAWLAVLGALVLPRDVVSGLVALASFATIGAWSWVLWMRRESLRMYTAMQLLLVVVALLTAVVVVVCRARGVTDAPELGQGISLALPWWTLGVAPALMAFLALRERSTRAH